MSSAMLYLLKEKAWKKRLDAKEEKFGEVCGTVLFQAHHLVLP